ncbi:Tricalbin-2 [Dispira simplex]|nr:Tricalbin-2 [Dispira simplex]
MSQNGAPPTHRFNPDEPPQEKKHHVLDNARHYPSHVLAQGLHKLKKHGETVPDPNMASQGSTADASLSASHRTGTTGRGESGLTGPSAPVDNRSVRSGGTYASGGSREDQTVGHRGLVLQPPSPSGVGDNEITNYVTSPVMTTRGIEHPGSRGAGEGRSELTRRRTMTIRVGRGKRDLGGIITPRSPSFLKGDVPNTPISPTTPSATQAGDGGSSDALVAGWREAGVVNAHKGQGPLDSVWALIEQFDRHETWRNAAVLMVAVPITWLLTKLGAGLFGCLIAMSFLVTYYRNAVTRFRHKVRDDIRRELILPKFETDLESVEWLNAFMTRFWLTFEPALSAIVIEQVDAILAASAPGFVDSLRLTTFTLGSKAPRVEAVKTFGKEDPDVIMMDWVVSFTPNDISDLTPRQLEERVNPKIVLTIRVGKGLVGAGMPVLVEDMVFSGKIRLKLRLMPVLPLVKTVEASFLEPPKIDFVLKPVGGDTLGFDVTNIPGLKSFIQEQINANMGPMMYAPNAFLVDVDAMMNGASAVDKACGVFMVNIRSARKLPNVDRLGTIDPFIRINVGGKQGVVETPQKNNTSNPVYDFKAPVLLTNVTDTLQFEVMTTKRFICKGEFDLARLQEDSHVEGEVTTLMRQEKEAGELYWSGAYFPVATPIKADDGTEVPMESDSGLLRFTVVQAHDLDIRRSSVGQLSPYVVVYLNGEILYKTKVMKRSNKPIWSESQEFFVPDKDQAKFKFVLRDSRLQSDLDLGEVVCTASEGIQRVQNQNTWFALNKASSGRLKLDFSWRPVLVDEEFLSGTTDIALLPCIGVVKLNLTRAAGLRNVERIGESDPYVKLLASNRLQARTRVISNNLNPAWNETFVIPVHRVNETLVLECMDFNKMEKDRPLGDTFFQVRQLLGEQVSSGTFALGTPLRATGSLRQRNGKMKGVLHYTATFYPIIPLGEDAPVSLSNPATEDNANGAAMPTPSTPSLETASPEPESRGTAAPESGSNHQPESSSGALAEAAQADASKVLTLSISQPLDGAVPTPAATRIQTVDYSAYSAGVMRMVIHEARGLSQAHPAQVVVTLNGNDYNPVLVTPFALGQRSRKWESACQFATPEVDYNTVTITCYSQGGDDEADRVMVGKWTAMVRDMLVPDFLQPEHGVWLQLEQKTGEIRISFEFQPTEMELDISESVTNMGTLRVEVLSAQDLPAADTSGTSDPYVVVSLNGEKVHKTPAIKKSLAPIWRSVVDIPLMIRHQSHLQFEVFDWNKIQSHTRLGMVNVPLRDLLVNQVVTESYKLLEKGKPSGVIRVRMLFTPEYINDAEEKLTMLNAAGSVVKAPIRMATGSAHLAGKAIGFGGHAIGSALGSLPGLNRLHTTKGKPELKEADSKFASMYVPNDTGLMRPASDPDGPNIPREASVPNEPGNHVAFNTPLSGAVGPRFDNVGGGGGTGPVSSVKPADAPVSPRSSTARSTHSVVGQGDSLVPSFSTVGGEALGKPVPGEPVPGILSITVIKAQNLDAADSNGLSDPYVRVRQGSKTLFKSKVHKKTLNPVWQENFKHRVKGDPEEALHFIIRDHNTFSGDKDLWQSDIPVWQYVSDVVRENEFDVTLANGTLTLALELVPLPTGYHDGSVRSQSSQNRHTVGIANSNGSGVGPGFLGMTMGNGSGGGLATPNPNISETNLRVASPQPNPQPPPSVGNGGGGFPTPGAPEPPGPYTVPNTPPAAPFTTENRAPNKPQNMDHGVRAPQPVPFSIEGREFLKEPYSMAPDTPSSPTRPEGSRSSPSTPTSGSRHAHKFSLSRIKNRMF